MIAGDFVQLRRYNDTFRPYPHKDELIDSIINVATHIHKGFSRADMGRISPILNECLKLSCYKNARYKAAAAYPTHFFSSSSEDLILLRIDEKLCRVQSAVSKLHLADLVDIEGYLLLYLATKVDPLPPVSVYDPGDVFADLSSTPIQTKIFTLYSSSPAAQELDIIANYMSCVSDDPETRNSQIMTAYRDILMLLTETIEEQDLPLGKFEELYD